MKRQTRSVLHISTTEQLKQTQSFLEQPVFQWIHLQCVPEVTKPNQTGQDRSLKTGETTKIQPRGPQTNVQCS